MAVGIIFLVVALFALVGCIRQIKIRNFFGGGYAFLTLAVFGWFSIMTLYAAIWGGGAVSGE